MIALLSLLLLQLEAPVVHIHAPTRIELDSPKRVPSGFQIAGRLVDDETNDAVPGQIVVVTSLEDELGFAMRRGVLTDENGHFDLHLNLPPGRHRIIANFAGDGTLAPARTERTADLGLRPLEITVEGPSRARRGERMRFRVMATTDGAPADVPVQVASGERNAEAPRVVIPAVRMRDGAAEVEMVAQGRGPQKLEASYAGDAQFNAARGEARYVVELPVTMTLTSPSAGATIKRGDTIMLAGVVRDADGALALAAVEIRVLGQPIMVAQADALGTFEAELDTRKLAAGHLQIDAAFRPTAPWHVATRSPALSFTLVAPASPPLAVFALPGLLAVAVGLGFWLRRKAGAWRARRITPPQATPPAPAEARGLRIVAAQRTFRASDLVVDGTILDARTDATLVAEVESRTLKVESRADGRFSITLEPGSHDIVVRAEGYCAETFTVAVPHRGQLRGVEVRIAPIRLRVLEAFRAAAAPALRERAFDLQTPREIAPLGGPALAELAALVEETNYSGRPAAPEQAERARVLAEEELTRGKPIHTMRPQ